MPAVDGGALLERSAEIEAIDAAIAAASAGAGCALLIGGTAGIGKTRLLAATSHRAQEAGMAVLTARGSELESDFAWGLVRQLFERVLADLPAEQRSALLTDAAALAAPALGLADGSGAGLEEPFSILHGLYWLTANLSQREPLLLAVDDLHWADAPSLRFLAYVIDRLEGLRILTVLTARTVGEPAPAGSVELVYRISVDPVVRQLHPAPLSLPAASDLIRAELRGNADQEFCDACHEVTGGNPFLLHELLGELSHEGVTPTAEAAARVRSTTPQLVSRSVLLRLARLSPRAVALARAVAVLGPRASLRRAGALAGIGEGAAADAAGALIAADILVDEAALDFVHPILRTAVLGDLSAPERSRWHREAAHLLAAGGAPAEEVATHLLATAPSESPWEVTMLREAARLARERAAPEGATAYLQRALLEPPPDDQRAEVLHELGIAEAVEDPASASDHLGQALELTREPNRRAEIALALGRALAYSGRFVDAADVIERGIAELPEEDSPLRAALEAEFLNGARWDLSTRPRTYPVIESLKRRAARGEPLDPRLRANLAVELSAEGRDLEGAVAHARRALAGSELMAPEASASLPQAISVLLHADLPDEAWRFAEDWLATAQQRGWPLVSALAATVCALIAVTAGAVSDAIAHATQALSPSVEAWLPPFGVAFLIEGLSERGDLASAREELARRGLDGDLPVAWPFTPLLYYRGRLHAAGGDHRSAASDLLRCGELSEAWGVRNPGILPWRSSAAASLAALGRRDEAIRLAREELALAERWGTKRAVGVALRALANAELRPDGLRAAISALEGAPAPLELARALMDLGAALRRAGQRNEARSLLRRGLDVAHRQGSVALAERAREELIIAGGRPRRRAPWSRRPHSERASGGADGGLGSDQPSDRPGAVRHAQDGRDPPDQHLREALDQLTKAVGRRASDLSWHHALGASPSFRRSSP